MVRGNISKALTRRPDRTVRPAQCPAWAPLGRALQDFWANGSTSELPPLLYWSNLRSEPEELPPALFFRRPAEMPPVERYALDLCRQQGGRILDVGAGAGSHVLALQSQGLHVDAIDICPGAVEVMRSRGIAARQGSFWKLGPERYDTLLMLMNTAGASGDVRSFQKLLQKLKEHLTPQGQILLDVSPPDWMALRRARRTRRTRIPEEQVQEGQWAMLNCWLSYGQMEGTGRIRGHGCLSRPSESACLAENEAGVEDTGSHRASQRILCSNDWVAFCLVG